MKVRAIVVREKGGPEVLRFEEIELSAPGPGEVRVRHEAIGVNYIDVYFRTGWYPPPAYPFVPGMEAVGVVEAIGPGVSDVAVGERVGYASRPLGA
jgi:NADPH2:quinone reductase